MFESYRIAFKINYIINALFISAQKSDSRPCITTVYPHSLVNKIKSRSADRDAEQRRFTLTLYNVFAVTTTAICRIIFHIHYTSKTILVV